MSCYDNVKNMELEGWKVLVMDDLTKFIRDELISHGADLVGVGALSELPSNTRCGLPIGICIAVKYPKEVILSISVSIPDQTEHLFRRVRATGEISATYPDMRATLPSIFYNVNMHHPV